MDVKKVAELARLTITDKEEALYKEQFTSILNYFNKLDSINTDGIEPMVTPTEIPVFWRKDEAEAWTEVEEALSAAPETSGKLFKVPPVV